MADVKPNISTNKLAMSRALGAAFLNHQVEQLEKTVSSNGPASGNWRDRKGPYGPSSPGSGKRSTNSPGVKIAQKKKGGADGQAAPQKDRAPAKDRYFDRSIPSSPGARRRSAEEDRKDKDADIVVVDASVLIHALYQVKKWCRDGREEVVVVPLEVLNTLDLLKKGTSSLAQKARAASRILEAQVGTNPRIRVQRDDAFVLWDKISFDSDEPNTNCPEWVRRVICCARWETDHPDEELNFTATNEKKPPKVILAVLSTLPNMSPQSVSLKLADMSLAADAPLTPVPLPAPSTHTNRHEIRSTGALVSAWAAKAGIELREVDQTLPGRPEDEERPKRSHGSRGRRPSASDNVPRAGLVERPPAVMAMMEMISQPSKVVRVLARGEKLDP